MLTFEFTFEFENDEVEFATLPPYSYTMLIEFLKANQIYIEDGNNSSKNKYV